MNCEEARVEAQAKKSRMRVQRKKQRRCRWVLGGHVYRVRDVVSGWATWECLCCGRITDVSPRDWRVVEE